MAYKNPIVVSDDGKKHETLEDGNTLAPGSIPVSTESGNGLSVKSDGLFSKAGGSSGYGDPTIIDEPINMGYIERQYYDLLKDKTITKGVAYHYTNVTNGGVAIEYAGPGIIISAVPAGDGIIATYSGIMFGSNKQMLRIIYSDGNNQVVLVDNTWGRTLSVDKSLTGNGDVGANLGVKLSTAANNTLSLLTDSDTPGLFVPPSKSLTRGTSNGNFSFGYPDTKSADYACGKMGKGVYWKITLSMNNAGANNAAVVPRIWIDNIPCMEDGTLVPYQFAGDYVRNHTIPTVTLWFICMGVPTHLMDVTDGTLMKLQRSYNGLVNGLDDLYPLAPSGETAQEPTWRMEYFYTP